MKKITLALALFVLSYSCINAQSTLGKLWGMVPQGSDSGNGLIFNYDSLGKKYTIVRECPANDGSGPYSDFIQAADGNYYATAQNGGIYRYGAIVEWNPITKTESVVYSFTSGLSQLNNNAIDGANPVGNLLVAKDGNLYGTTQNGGANNSGIIFEWNMATKTETVLYSFYYTAPDGQAPIAALVQGSDGNFYGMNPVGGANGFGVIYEWDTALKAENVIYNFAGGTTDGATPNGSLLQTQPGIFYGLTSSRGTNGNGTVFEWNNNTQTETVVYNFAGGADGAIPNGSLILAKDARLYGLTSAGGTNSNGTIFSYDTTAVAETTLYSFAGGTTDGAGPNGSLMQAKDGNLYGLTGGGGDSSDGALFEWNTTTLAESLMFSFIGGNINGSAPSGSLIQGTDGNFYGLDNGSGLNNSGTMFEWNVVSKYESVLHLFGTTISGVSPNGSLMQAKDGNFYGVTAAGGTANGGTIFKLTAAGAVTVLHNFSSYTGDGAVAYGSLVQARDGNFYGITTRGGHYGRGTLFEYDTTAQQEDTLVSFDGVSVSSMDGSLIVATDGNLYGLAGGGAYSKGMIFEYNTTAKSLSTLASFNPPSTGSFPRGSLIQAKDGNFYGMTKRGGTNKMGTIFEYDNTANTLTTLVNFSNSEYPQGDLIQATDGNLYGMTSSGGTNSMGSVFEYNTTTQSVSTLISFTHNENPFGSLLQASNGDLYGMTYRGGANGLGSVFQYTMANGKLNTLVSFNDTNGELPSYANLIEAMSASVTEYCGTSTLQAHALGAQGALTYKWSTGATTPSIVATTNGSYSVTIKDARGISVKGSLTYPTLVQPVSVTTGNSITICNGTDAGLSALANGGTGTITYSWLPGPVTGSAPNVSPTATTVYTVIAKDAVGCTDTNKQMVNVNQPSTSSMTESACEYYVLNGSAYAATGIYIQHLTNKVGCDSALTLNLIIRKATSTTITKTVCNDYVLNGATYSSTGTYTQVIMNKAGCDSTITLTLTITGGATVNLTETACDEYSWNGNTYKTSGSYTENLTTKGGCDSTITLDLTINPLPTVGITGTSNVSIGSNDVLTATGNATSFIWSDGSTNDTANVMPLSNVTYTVTGTDGNGCEDTATFKVTVGPTGVSNLSNSDSTTLYPNPGINIVNLTFTMQGADESAVIKVIDMSGKEVMEGTTTIGNGKVTRLNISDLTQGMYFVKVITENNTQVVKFVKE